MAVVSLEEKHRMSPTQEFVVFWQNYPRKVGKLAAERAFQSARKNGASLEDLLSGIVRYVEHKPPYSDYCHPVTWLRQGRWLDEYEDGQDMVRAAAFLSRYAVLHAKYRSGALYAGDRESDMKEALQLVRVFDDARLDKIASVFLQDEDDVAATGTRSLAKLRSRASDADERLRVKGL
jgi:hypothetical protein